MECTNQKTIYPHRSIDWLDTPGNVEKPIQVPCGKCLPCLMSKRTDWAFRLQQEYKYSKSACFVTLTYDQKHMPTDMSLDVRHLQLYLKRLRKMEGKNKIRYYAVGEYGTKSGRPHYHILLFNASQENARLAWRDIKRKPIGMVHIGTVTPASVAYCLKYIVQPEMKEPTDGRKKAFSTMSRAYGIGGRYLTDEMIAWHRADDRNYVIVEKQKRRLPRFYREKIWYRPTDRERISSAAMKLTLDNQEKERNYYKAEHGDRWEHQMMQARNMVLSRIKTKIRYTQKI